MLSVVKKVIFFLNSQERRRAIRVLIVLLMMAVLEMVGVFSILPFLAILANPAIVHKSNKLLAVYNYFHFQGINSFLFFLGMLSLGLMIFSNAFTVFSSWVMYGFVHDVEAALSGRLLAKYLYKPYTYFLNCNTSDLSKNILSEVSLVVHGVILPGMQALAKTFVSLVIFTMLIFIYPIMTLITVGILGGTYLLINLTLKKRLEAIGGERQATGTHKYRAVNEALGGIKDIKIYGKEQSFLARYSLPAKIYSRHSAAFITLAQMPRYIIETIAFGGIIIITLYLLGMNKRLDYILPLLGLYALVGYRLMPALTQIFAGLTSIRFYQKSIDVLYNDVNDQWKLIVNEVTTKKPDKLLLERELVLRDLTFYYPGTNKPVIQDLNLKIFANQSIAFVGSTGSGKTTLADIVMGLLKPDRGEILVDDKALNPDQIRNWQMNCGYVPQYIFLLDDTVTRNIAFGVRDKEIDQAAVSRAAQTSYMHDFIINELPEKYETEVGERGVRLSGGQRQRLGIARALYHDPGLLIFDEATSSLDGATESIVMESIHNLKGKKTMIIIAHRLSTIKACDQIYLLDTGKIIAQGSYDELMRTSEKFQGFARNITK